MDGWVNAEEGRYKWMCGWEGGCMGMWVGK